MKDVNKFLLFVSAMVALFVFVSIFGLQDSNLSIADTSSSRITAEDDEIDLSEDPSNENNNIGMSTDNITNEEIILNEEENSESLIYLIPDESQNTTINFLTNTSAEDQSKITWGYSEWRQYIILQSYGVNESELEESYLNNETFQHNLHISTLMAWGQYNGSLSEEDLKNLYDQMEHNSVVFKDAWAYESSDERLHMGIEISVKSNAWLVQYYEARTVDIKFWSSDPNGKWHN